MPCGSSPTRSFAPFAAERDEKHLFPRESLQRGGELGLGGIYVSEEFGGTGLTR
ncbi:hypothetical protein CTI14_66240, partial [Methylobacterium radiotolerans]